MQVLEFIGWQLEKRKCAAGLEVDPDHLGLACRVDDKVVGMRSAEDGAGKTLKVVVVLARVDPALVFAQIDDHLHRAFREQTLLLVRTLNACVVPKQLDKGGKRRPR